MQMLGRKFINKNNMKQITLITGAGRGIGKEIALKFASEKHDLIFPLSMASKGSCCIGGNLATNAGGIQVLRYGNARDLCIGIEAVLPCGGERAL